MFIEVNACYAMLICPCFVCRLKNSNRRYAAAKRTKREEQHDMLFAIVFLEVIAIC